MDNIKTTGAAKGAAKNPADVYGKPNGPAAKPSTSSNVPIPNPNPPAPKMKGPSVLPPKPERPARPKSPSKASQMIEIAEKTIKSGEMREHLKSKEAVEVVETLEVTPASAEVSQKVHPLALGKFVPPTPQLVQVGEAYLEVSKKLPYSELIAAIEWCINVVVDERTFVSAPLAEIIEDIAMLKFFTNLDTSDIDQKYFTPVDFYTWYDIISEVNAMVRVRSVIDKGQQDFLHRSVGATLHSIVAYRNSAAGIVDALAARNSDDKNDLQSALSVLTNGDQEGIQTLMKMYTELGAK